MLERGDKEKVVVVVNERAKEGGEFNITDERGGEKGEKSQGPSLGKSMTKIGIL